MALELSCAPRDRLKASTPCTHSRTYAAGTPGSQHAVCAGAVAGVAGGGRRRRCRRRRYHGGCRCGEAAGGVGSVRMCLLCCTRLCHNCSCGCHRWRGGTSEDVSSLLHSLVPQLYLWLSPLAGWDRQGCVFSVALACATTVAVVVTAGGVGPARMCLHHWVIL
eukprot:41572-Chlamydomonas_euryale.AAC.7